MEKSRWIKLIVSITLIGSYFLLPKYGFTFDGDIINHLLYPISHVNIWHLAVNIICLWLISCQPHIFISLTISVLCSFLPCLMSEPTMGFSGVLFAMVGISWGKVKRFKDMIWLNKWYLIIPVFVPHVNFMIHIYCLLAGYLYGRYATRD